MELLRIALALFKAGFPLPTFTDLEGVKAWLANTQAPVAELIVHLANQMKTNNRVSIELPDGEEVVLYEEGVYCAVDTDSLKAKLEAIPPEKIGDGKFLELFMKYLPELLKLLPLILPLFLDDGDEEPVV